MNRQRQCRRQWMWVNVVFIFNTKTFIVYVFKWIFLFLFSLIYFYFFFCYISFYFLFVVACENKRWKNYSEDSKKDVIQKKRVLESALLRMWEWMYVVWRKKALNVKKIIRKTDALSYAIVLRRTTSFQ